MYEQPQKKGTDPWWKFGSAVEEFNELRKTLIHPSNHVCLDELMSAWCPKTSKLGGLPNISFIKRKPQPLGTEMKCSSCSDTGIIFHLEIQKGKDTMKTAKYNNCMGATAGCSVRLAEQRYGMK